MKPLMRALFATAALAAAVGDGRPVAADPDDPAGWFLNVDPRRRAFLTHTSTAGGPRLIMFGCLRDADTFTTMSSAVGPRENLPRAVLRLSDAATRFEVAGEVVLYPRDGTATFISDIDADAVAMRAIGRRLMPLLSGTGDLAIDIGPADGAGVTRRAVLPRSGLATLLPRFADVCFR